MARLEWFLHFEVQMVLTQVWPQLRCNASGALSRYITTQARSQVGVWGGGGGGGGGGMNHDTTGLEVDSSLGVVGVDTSCSVYPMFEFLNCITFNDTILTARVEWAACSRQWSWNCQR